MNVAILGIDISSQSVANIINQHYNPLLKNLLGEPLNIVAFVSGKKVPTHIGDIPVLDFLQTVLLYHKKVIDKIILTRELYFEEQKSSLLIFRMNGIKIEDICVSARLSENMNLLNFIESYSTVRYFPHIEFRIADQCNLNCKMCTEYCALIKEQHFYPLEDFTRDFEQLHKFIDDFGAIRILGGEPLLNPDVNEYIKISRNLYPATPIHIVTNAILLPKMTDEFFDTVRENNAQICISFYKPMKSKMPEIQKLLEEKKVNYLIGAFVEKFGKRNVLNRHNNGKEIFNNCLFSYCHNLCDGKIAACFMPFVTKYFNEYYNKNIPEVGELNLYEEGLTTEKLKKHLLTPFERCSYCKDTQSFDWEVTSHPSPISDWVLDA